jgi:hypothetical protein
MNYQETLFKNIVHFQGYLDFSSPQERLKEVRKNAKKFREQMLSNSEVVFYKTFDLIRIPYPKQYGLLNACSMPTPFIHILNRLYIIQFKTEEGIKTLLFSPSDIYANRETPFFKRLTGRLGLLKKVGEKIIAIELGTVEKYLAKTGIKPEQVDYISYDHLHTQDLRKWLGTSTQKAYFPNAKLIVTKQEWESVHGLLPPQADWYCINGVRDLPQEKIILMENDLMLGEGVAMINTPGHTEGNHSLVVNTSDGLLVSSENGISADSYSPLNSEIPGLRKYAKETGMEVILNGNTLEKGITQYISMVMEKEIAGTCPHNPQFFNVVPSSELSTFWAFPGIKPTFSFGSLEYGSPYIKEKN